LATTPLDKKVLQWIHQQGWTSLRPIQQDAIKPIIAGGQDVIISASTAAGKTEAFFLPACTVVNNALENNAKNQQGFGILYISPLKALINDQYRRLESLGELFDMPVTPWHGDSSVAKKRQIEKNPSGILLITPESLESMLIQKSGWVSKAFAGLKHIVIDEFHAFIGSERGCQLISVLNRLDVLLNRQNDPVPRVALSATLGELDRIPELLRPDRLQRNFPFALITDDTKPRYKMQLRGYVNPLNSKGSELVEMRVCRDLYQICRGGSHLVFANSRKRTESITAQLSDFCQQQHVPNEFFPHHGSLAKNLRETLEARLQKEHPPTTAICTMTLELGIDIGKVDSVVQVTAPHSVSSLRQRLGRSGRRGGSAILRMLITENELSAHSSPTDSLRMQLLQSLAIWRLLVVEKWYEPADNTQYHFSTLLHQVLALTAQWGGVRADQLFKLLCRSGPFNHVSSGQFKQLLSHMGSKDLLTQLGSGELVLGLEGEKLAGHYTFFAVFNTPEEYRLMAEGKSLGTLPMNSLVIPGQHIVFGGRRWKVLEVNAEKKFINVQANNSGKPPNFGGSGIAIHERIRQEMFNIASSGEYRIAQTDKEGQQQYVDFIDATAKEQFQESHQYFKAMKLDNDCLFDQGLNACLIPWLGDKKINTLVVLLISQGFKAGDFAGAIEIERSTAVEVKSALVKLLITTPPTHAELAKWVPEKCTEKYDEWLPEALLLEGYGQKNFDVAGTFAWIKMKFG
jgi:ATP-dependent Lhr-like helicase